MIYLKYAECKAGAALHGEATKLLCDVLKSAFGMENADSLIKKANSGKPYIENAPFDFSYAHTSGAVAAAVCGAGAETPDVISDKTYKNIGADIECADRKTDADLLRRIADKYFTKAEREYINAEKPGRQVRFLEIWTKKESILKASGAGLSGISAADTFNFAGMLKTKTLFIGGKKYIISVAAV